MRGRRRLIERRGVVDRDGATVQYTLLRMPRRRHVHLVVDDDGGVQVRAPWRFDDAEAAGIIERNLAWVLEAMARVAARRARRAVLESGTELPLLDGRLRLEVQGPQLELWGRAAPAKGALKTLAGRIWRARDTLHVEPTAPGEPGVRELLELWYRREARRLLSARVASLGDAVGAHPARLAIRGQRSRWGSCSSRGTISLNWRLLLLPSPLVDYVLVHELCHLHHMDHSARFWARVADVVPDYRERRAMLDEMQAALPL